MTMLSLSSIFQNDHDILKKTVNILQYIKERNLSIEAANSNPTVHVKPSIHDVWMNTFHTDEVIRMGQSSIFQLSNNFIYK